MSFISCFQIGNSIWRSNSVCICPFDDNIARCKNVRRRHCYKNKSEHRLGQIYHVCCYSMLFVSNIRILSNRSSRPRCSLKRGSPINSAKPTLTGKTYAKAFLHITKRLRHMYSPAGISRNPQEHSSNITPPGAASVVIYTLKMTELPPGVERKMII